MNCQNKKRTQKANVSKYKTVDPSLPVMLCNLVRSCDIT